MKYICLIACVLWSPLRANAQENDSPEVLEWVLKTANVLEERLNNAVLLPDPANLLIKLSESYEDFDAVALIGLYCPEARKSAELGKTYCNWLNTPTHGKDVNALIALAQDARSQAFKMHDAADKCLASAKQYPPNSSFTWVDIIRTNAEFIEHDLNDGEASQNMHILSQKVEYAKHIFHDTQILSARLNNCDKIYDAATEGLNFCTEILAAPNWATAKVHLQKALEQSLKIKEWAGACR